MLALRTGAGPAVSSPFAGSSFQVARPTSIVPDPTSSTALLSDAATPRLAYKPKRAVDGEYARLARKALSARFVKAWLVPDADVAQYAQLCAFAIVVSLLAGLPFAATRPLFKPLDSVIVGLALRFVGAGSLGLIALVPVHLLRKSQRTLTEPLAMNPFMRLYDSRTTAALLAYLVSAAISTVAVSLYLTRPDAFVPLSPGFTSRAPWQIEPAFLINAAALVTISVIFAYRHIVEDRFVVRLPSSTAHLGERTLARCAERLPRALGTALSIGGALGAVGMINSVGPLRKLLLRFLVFPLPVIGQLRPRLHAVYRGTPALGIGFAWAEVIALAALWETVNCLYDVYSSQPLAVSIRSANPTQCLVEGIELDDPFLKHFAVLELRQIAKADATRRAAIFADIKSRPVAFERIARELLLILGRSYATVESRGQPAKTSTASAEPAQPPPDPATSSTAHGIVRAELKRDNVLRPPPKSPFAFLTNSVKPPPDPAAPPSTATKLVNALPDPFRAKITALKPKPATEQAEPLSDKPIVPSQGVVVPPAVARLAAAYLPRLFAPLPRSSIARCVPDPHLSSWAVEALSRLTAASLLEDPYGTVQQEIPQITEALVRHLAAFERYFRDLTAGDATDAATREAVQDVVQPVITASYDAVSRVALAFEPSWTVFRLPGFVAERVQRAIDERRTDE